MEFKVEIQYQTQYGPQAHVLGIMSAPHVYQLFQQIDWRAEKENFKQTSLSHFPVFSIEALATGQRLDLCLQPEAKTIEFSSTYQCTVSAVTSDCIAATEGNAAKENVVSVDRFVLENAVLALSLFLADDQQQLHKLYDMLSPTQASYQNDHYATCA